MTFIIVFVLMLTVIALMSVGVVAGRKPISGSCGGIGAVGIDPTCKICGGNPNKCEPQMENNNKPNSSATFYEAE